MKTLAILAVLICCLLMFVVKRPYKAGILMLSAMFFTSVQLSFLPIHTATLLIVLSFLLSEFGHFKQLFRNSKGTIVWKLTGLSVITCIITIFFSPHLNNGDSILIFIQAELFLKYFALVYAFWCYNDEKSLRPTINITFWGFIVLTLLAAVNYFTKQSDFISAVMEGTSLNGSIMAAGEAGTVYTYSDRFRVQATFANPFDYGYICVIMMLIHLYGSYRKIESRKRCVVVVLCAIFGIVTCGARTVILCAMIGVSVFYLLAFKFSRSLRLLLVAIFLFALSYQFIPAVQEPVDNMLTMFDKNSSVQGSSIEMRALQYSTVLYYIQDSPIVGRGYGFFMIDMGWGKGRRYLMDERLQGLEGVVMSLLLERGILGLGLYLLFYTCLIVFFLKKRKASKLLTSLGLALISLYLSFANMTGELSSVYPTLLTLGFVVKAVNSNQVLFNDLAISNNK